MTSDLSLLNRTELRQTAATAARRAGDFLAGGGEAARLVNSAIGRDLKLAADVQSQQIILDTLQPSDIAVLSEEQESGAMNEDGLRWIVDPLDGTVNYARGIPICCVSIALWSGAVPLLGCIYDFNRRELFEGIAGTGAWLNGASIRSTAAPSRSAGVLATGFPLSTDFGSVALTDFTRSVQEYKKIRFIGSAALSLAYVAAGRFDAYYERDIKLWDVAAGIALIKAAGGVVRTRPSAVEFALHVAAASSESLLPDIA